MVHIQRINQLVFREIFQFEDGADLALDWSISDKYREDTPTLIVVPGTKKTELIKQTRSRKIGIV
jgi:hypothetical protein